MKFLSNFKNFVDCCFDLCCPNFLNLFILCRNSFEIKSTLPKYIWLS